MNMKQWFEEARKSPKKKAIPVLTFPIASKLGMTVRELLSTPENQAKGLVALAEDVDTWMVLSFMDLSVEAEAFGADVIFSDDDIPKVSGEIISDEESIENLEIPEVGAGRTQIYIDGVKLAKEKVKDKPILAGCIGPFSLAGNLMGITNLMMEASMNPEPIHKLLEKTTSFIIDYLEEYKKNGADGVCMAEPMAGLLAPNMVEDFSSVYVKRIVDAVQDDNFSVVYHNCGNSTIRAVESILNIGAHAHHFGNIIDMKEMMEKFPEDRIALGNLDPAGAFAMGTEEEVREGAKAMLEACGPYPNYIPSSGCDIPASSPWENIDAFFEEVDKYYRAR